MKEEREGRRDRQRERARDSGRQLETVTGQRETVSDRDTEETERGTARKGMTQA